MNTLNLILTKQWYDMIESGIKKEEYREIKDHWAQRLEGKKFDTVTFRNGYRADARTMTLECKGITKGTARPEWSGGTVSGPVYVIKLGKFIDKSSISSQQQSLF